MSSIGTVTGELIDVVYRRSGIDAPTRMGLINDAYEQFGESRLEDLSSAQAAIAIKGLATLACRQSLEIVSRGLRHDRVHAEEVFLNLGLVANLILTTPGLDLRYTETKGANRELVVMGALWAGLATDEAKQPGHARFTTREEDNDTSDTAYSDAYDILLTTPTKRQHRPHKTKFQVKGKRPTYMETRGRTGKKLRTYEDDIIVIPTDELAANSELDMLEPLATLDFAVMTDFAHDIDKMVDLHKLLRPGRRAAYRAGQTLAQRFDAERSDAA